VAVDLETRELVTLFQSNLSISEMLRLASGFGLRLGGDGAPPYGGHDVWEMNLFGAVLAMAAADETTGVAASGADITASDARSLMKAALDAFDGRSARLLDAPGLSRLVENVPLGFAALGPVSMRDPAAV
jgi:hypothetical protein